MRLQRDQFLPCRFALQTRRTRRYHVAQDLEAELDPLLTVHTDMDLADGNEALEADLSATVTFPEGAEEVLVPTSQMRKGIAAQMTRSLQAPHAYVQMEIDATRLVGFRVGGALVALASYYGSDISIRLENTTDVTPVGNALQLAAAAGIIGGLAYWLIAGRNAGRWRAPPAA